MRISRVHFVLSLCVGLAGRAYATTYFDTINDNWGPPESDITAVTVTNDPNNVNIQIFYNPNANFTNNYYANTQIGFQIGNGAGGQTIINSTYGVGDPTAGTAWGQPVGISTGLNFFAGIFPDGPGYSGGVQFYNYNATTGWSSLLNSGIIETPTGNPSIIVSLPTTLFNLNVHDSFKFDVWTTYSGANSAYDALDNPFGTFFGTPGLPYSSGGNPPTPYDSATATNTTFNSTTFTIGAILSWNNTGGTGNGTTWDAGNNQNFNDGSNPATFSTGDNVTFDDTNNGHYAVTLSGTLSAGSVVINTSNAYVFSGSGGIGGAADISINGSGTVTLNTINPATGKLNVNAGTLILGANGALGNIGVNVASGAVFTVNGALAPNARVTNAGMMTVAGNLSLTPSARTLASLNIGAGGTTTLANALSSAAPLVLTVRGLTIAGAAGAWTGQLEIGNNSLIVETTATGKTTALPAVQDQVAHTAGGTVGITSSTAVADPTHKLVVVVDNALLGLTSFNGSAVDANSILVETTYFGDSNLDRKVDVTDLGTLATNYGKAVPNGIIQGDFNGDGKVDVTDLGMLATDYGLGTNQPAAVASVPEPASLTLAAIAAMPLLARFRRRVAG
jgi:hypothetical protein